MILKLIQTFLWLNLVLFCELIKGINFREELTVKGWLCRFAGVVRDIDWFCSEFFLTQKFHSTNIFALFFYTLITFLEKTARFSFSQNWVSKWSNQGKNHTFITFLIDCSSNKCRFWLFITCIEFENLIYILLFFSNQRKV